MNHPPVLAYELADGQKATLAARRTLMALALLLISALFLSMLMVVGVAWNQNQESVARESQLLHNPWQQQQRTQVTELRDYAFWQEAWLHMYLTIDPDWAWHQQNLGPGLFSEHHYNGVFVVDVDNRTRYAMIDGKLSSLTLEAWLGDRALLLVERARQQMRGQKVISENIMMGETPALVAAAPITRGKMPHEETLSATPSVMVFVYRFTPDKLRAFGNAVGVENARVPDDAHDRYTSPFIEENVSQGEPLVLRWDPSQPGRNLLLFLLPLLALAALVIGVVTRRVINHAMNTAMLSDTRFLQLMHSQRELAASEARFRDVAEATSDWIWETDASCRITYLSRRFSIVTGFGLNMSTGRLLDEILCHDALAISEWVAQQRSGGPRSQLRCYLQSVHHGLRTCSLVAKPIMLRGKLLGYRGTVSDISHEVEAQARVHYLSQHDVLTGLPNRLFMQEFLQEKLRSQPTFAHPLVMISLDLDRFKPINDTWGHAAGDSVLIDVARRLRACLTAGDLVARLGGDEFILIATDLRTTADIEACCQRLLDDLHRAFFIGDQELYIGASLGIARAPQDAMEADELLRLADIALYKSKRQGRDRWVFYTGEMSQLLARRSDLERKLRRGIAAGELRLHYQPRYHLESGQLEGAAAVIRWAQQPPALVMPDSFIPLAEQTGLIVEISNWVLHRACHDATSWPQALSVSVNISPIEFRTGNLALRVAAALENSGLEAFRLELEITENITMDHPESALAIMGELKAMGVKIAVDDFGAGFASLSYLKSFPFDSMKMDRSYMEGYPQDAQAHAIVEGIIGLGRAFSLEVTAEGIETQEQLEELKRSACYAGQGYLLGRPVPLEAFNLLLDKPVAESDGSGRDDLTRS